MAIIEEIESTGSRRRLRALSPSTLEPIGEFDCATAEDVKLAVERARKAQSDWARRSFDERAAVLYRLLDQFVSCQDEIIDAVVQETGKARAEAISMEIYAPCDALTYYAKNAKKILKPQKRRIHGMLGLMKKLRVIYEPLGVVGLITPWNGPVALAVVPMAQALMAGNAIVHKPSEVTPFSALLVKQFTEAADFPPDLYQVVQGDGHTGAALVEAGVDKISFTGSVNTGRLVAEACGRQLIPCTMELGGKDAMIVCADADLDRAAEGAVLGSCMNTGHYCCGTERVYAVGEIYDAFVDKVVERTRALRQSDTGETDVGAVFWDRQLEIIESHVNDAKAKGATIHLGGQRNPKLKGLYFEPTVVTGLTHDMDLMTKETFGPIVSIMRVQDEAEAIRLANDSEYGLNGNVWTGDSEKAQRIAEKIETGGVCINDMAITYGIHEAPFGGVKASGVGKVNSATGLKGYCHEKPIASDRRGKGKIQGGYPYTKKSEEGLQKLIRFWWGTPLGRFFS